jgi:hypothetical protein
MEDLTNRILKDADKVCSTSFRREQHYFLCRLSRAEACSVKLGPSQSGHASKKKSQCE